CTRWATWSASRWRRPACSPRTREAWSPTASSRGSAARRPSGATKGKATATSSSAPAASGRSKPTSSAAPHRRPRSSGLRWTSGPTRRRSPRPGARAGSAKLLRSGGVHHSAVRALPQGTVTFLFTDIEGSTRLLHELGPSQYADALARHRRLVREAADAHGGVEVDTQGDAFFIAFPTPAGAAAAAEAACDGLAAGAIRVRIGLPTGAPTATEEGYV